jgi:hypothetical protein
VERLLEEQIDGPLRIRSKPLAEGAPSVLSGEGRASTPAIGAVGPRPLLHLQRLAGNRAVSSLVLQRQETSFPDDSEERLTASAEGGEGTATEEEQGTVQTHVQRDVSSGSSRRPSRDSAPPSRYFSAVVQRKGGPSVGQLCIRSNVISEGLTAGHSWLSFTPTGGAETTWGTWGNRTPIGLHRDLEVGRSYKASRCASLDATDRAAVDSFASANNAWSYTNNCASFAARGWAAVTGESLSHTTWGIPNPSALGAGIQSANGGSPTGAMAPAAAGAGAEGGGGSSGDSSL